MRWAGLIIVNPLPGKHHSYATDTLRPSSVLL
jgi:hypothetical protein